MNKENEVINTLNDMVEGIDISTITEDGLTCLRGIASGLLNDVERELKEREYD